MTLFNGQLKQVCKVSNNLVTYSDFLATKALFNAVIHIENYPFGVALKRGHFFRKLIFCSKHIH